MDPSGVGGTDDSTGADEHREAASRASGRDERVQHLVGTWYGTSVPARGRGYARWTDPSVTRLVGALLRGERTRTAALELGAARRAAGFTRAEVTADWIGLQRVLPAGIRRQVDERALHGHLLAGWARPVAATEPSERGVGTAESLQESIAAAYRWADAQGTHPGDGFVLLVADVDVDGGDRAMWGSTVHRLARELSDRFDRVEQVVELTPGRFGVLVRRHPGLAVTVEALELQLAASVELAGAATLWVVPLPREAGAFPRLRARVADRSTPLWALGHLVTGRREVLAWLLEDSRRWLMPISTLRRSAAQRAGDAWNGGLRMVAAAAGVLVMTAGLVQAVEGGPERGAPAGPGSALSLAQPWGSTGSPSVTVPLERGGFAGVGGTTPTTTAVSSPPPAPSPDADATDADATDADATDEETGPTEAGERDREPNAGAAPSPDPRPRPSSTASQPPPGAGSTDERSGAGDGDGNREADSRFERGAAPEARVTHAGGPPEDRGGPDGDRSERARDQDGDEDRGQDRGNDRGNDRDEDPEDHGRGQGTGRGPEQG